jgi:hypothetical protein
MDHLLSKEKGRCKKPHLNISNTFIIFSFERLLNLSKKINGPIAQVV